MKLESLRGIGKITLVGEQSDISYNWYVQMQDWGSQQVDPITGDTPIWDIDGYNKSEAPHSVVNQKTVDIPAGYNSFLLYFEKMEGCVASVFVNGVYVEDVLNSNTYTDITAYVSAGTKAEIMVKVLRKFFSDPIGKVRLVSGTNIPNCIFEKVNLFDCAPAGALAPTTLPLTMQNGEKRYFEMTIPNPNNADVKVICGGARAKLCFLCNGHVAAKIMLDNDDVPSMVAGDRYVAYLPREWFQSGPVVILCQAIGDNARLDPFTINYYTVF